jgi:fructose-specific component phosphotransferase system IIB-like protein
VPIFGSSHDFYVAVGCNENTKSYTNLGNAYRNDTGLNGTKVFTGESNFQVKEIEVFPITLETNA